MPTHYDVLRMIPSANAAAIKKAYHKLALTHHPDKTLHLPEMERVEHEKLCKRATSAYEELSDRGRRASTQRDLRRISLSLRPTLLMPIIVSL
jgi:curved DNA-binding protein CbpA